MAIELNQNVSTVIHVGPLVGTISAMPVSTFTISGADAARWQPFSNGATYNIGAGYIQSASPVASGFYVIHLSAGTLSILGNAHIQLTDESLILPYAHQFEVVHSGYWNAKYGPSAVLALVVSFAANALSADGMDTATITAAKIGADAITSAKIAAGALVFGDQLSAFDTATSTIVTSVFNTYDPPTRTEATADKASLIAEFALLNDLTVDQVSAAVSGAVSSRFNTLSAAVDALADLTQDQVSVIALSALQLYHLDHLLHTAVPSNSIANSTIFGHLMATDGTYSTFNDTTDSLEAIRDRGDAAWAGSVDIASFVSAIWSAALADFTTVGTAGADLTSIQNRILSMQGDTFDESTDSLEAIRNRGDAAWVGSVDIASFVSAIWSAPLSSYTTHETAGAHVLSTLNILSAGVTANIDYLSVASAVWSMPLAPYVTAGQAGANLLSTFNLATTTQADTDDIQTRIPEALVGGRIDATIDATGFETGAQDALSTIVTSIFNTYDPPTRTEATADKASLIAEFVLLNDITVDQVSAAVSGAVSARFNTLSAAVDALVDLTQDQVSVIVTSVFNTYDPPTRTEATADKASLIAELALLNDLSVDQVSAAVSGAVSSRFETLSGVVAMSIATATRFETLSTVVDAILVDTGTDGVALADGAITAAKFGSGAIDAAALSADAATEMADAVWAKVLETQGSITAQQATQVILAVTAGATRSATSGFNFLTPNSAAIRVSIASVTADKERSAIVIST